MDLCDDAAHIHMGGKWHMPTVEQIRELMHNTESTWVSNYNGSGLNGRLFISKSDESKKLFLPASGYLGNCNCISTRTYRFGYFLSSSLFSFDDCYSTVLDFNSDDVSVTKCHRSFGANVRGVFNTFWIK